MVQAEEAADEIPRKREKQEKKRLKTEKTGCHCPGITRKKQCEECEETSERPKEKQSPRRRLRKMEWKTRLSSSPKPRKGNLFPRRSWLVVILKRQQWKSFQVEEIFPQRGTS